MAHAAPDIITITERLLLTNTEEDRNEACKAFIADTEELVLKVFLRHGGRDEVKSFCDWFYGWLWEKRKLESAHRALLEKVDSCECNTRELEVSFFKNYLAVIVKKSALNEFYSDIPKESLLQNPDGFDSFPAKQNSTEDSEERRKRIQDALEQFTPQLRIPFILKYFEFLEIPNELGILDEQDIAFISSETGRAADEIVDAIQTEADTKAQSESRPKFLLSSEFIGGLLELSDDAVYQRMRRARARFKSIRRQQEEEN